MMAYNAARMKDAGMNFVKEAAMAKLFSSQVAERVCSLALEIYGGYGFTKDYPVEKYFAMAASLRNGSLASLRRAAL